MKELIADAIYLLHFAILTPLLMSVLGYTGDWVKYNLITVPMIYGDWLDGDNYCALTALEGKLRGTWKEDERHPDAPTFMTPLVNGVLRPFGLSAERETVATASWYVYGIAFIISALRAPNFNPVPKTLASKIYVGIILLCVAIWVINRLYIPKKEDEQASSSG